MRIILLLIILPVVIMIVGLGLYYTLQARPTVVAGNTNLEPDSSVDIASVYSSGSGIINNNNSSTTSSSTATPTLPASGGPIISINFDDGWQSSYDNALPIFNAVGMKTTQYIITSYFTKKGFVTKDEVLKMNAKGHEIGAHTRSHPHLTQLPTAQAKTEIEGSRQDLIDMGIPVTTFAYPYGDENAAVEKLVKSAGFTGARVTRPEFNDKGVDPFLLQRQEVDASTTLDQIKSAIDAVNRNRKWLILVFHQTDEKGNPESVPHELIKEIVDYIQEKQIPVVTNSVGLSIMKNIN